MRIFLGIVAVLLTLNLAGTVALAKWVFREEIRLWKRERRRRRWEAEIRRNPPRTKWTATERLGTSVDVPDRGATYFVDDEGNVITATFIAKDTRVGDVQIPAGTYVNWDGYNENRLIPAERFHAKYRPYTDVKIAGSVSVPTRPGPTRLKSLGGTRYSPEQEAADDAFAREILKSMQ